MCRLRALHLKAETMQGADVQYAWQKLHDGIRARPLEPPGCQADCQLAAGECGGTLGLMETARAIAASEGGTRQQGLQGTYTRRL